MEQSRLAGACLRHHCDDLPVSVHPQFESALHLLKLPLASHEFGQPAPRGEIEVAPQRPDAHDLVNIDRATDASDFGRTHLTQFEIALDQTPRLFTDYDPVGWRCALHARRQIDYVAHR